jgi:hypothetical protein
MEIIRPSPPKTYRTRRRKAPAQPKSYRVVAEEVDGQKFQRVELAFRWMPWIMGGVLTVTLLLAYSLCVMSGWPVSSLVKPASIRCCGSSPIWIGKRLKWMRTFCGSAMRGKNVLGRKKPRQIAPAGSLLTALSAMAQAPLWQAQPLTAVCGDVSGGFRPPCVRPASARAPYGWFRPRRRTR